MNLWLPSLVLFICLVQLIKLIARLGNCHSEKLQALRNSLSIEEDYKIRWAYFFISGKSKSSR